MSSWMQQDACSVPKTRFYSVAENLIFLRLFFFPKDAGPTWAVPVVEGWSGKKNVGRIQTKQSKESIFGLLEQS